MADPSLVDAFATGGDDGFVSPHDDFAASLTNGSAPHDDFAHGVSRHPGALDMHPTKYAPPLQKRSAEEFESLPPQPTHFDSPWDFMKQDFTENWWDPKKGVLSKLLDTVAMPSHLIAHSLAAATHTPEADHHDLMDTVQNYFMKGVKPEDFSSPNVYAGVSTLAKAAGFGVSILADPLTWTGFGPTEHAVEAARTLKYGLTGVKDIAEGVSRTQPIAEVMHAAELTPDTIRTIAAPKLLSEHVQSVMKGLEDSGDVFERDAAGNVTRNESPLGQKHSALAELGKHLDPASLDQVSKAKYEEELTRLRTDPSEFTTTPWGVTARNVKGMEKVRPGTDATAQAMREADKLLEGDPLKNLARQQVLKEKQIEHGLPYMRVFGARTPLKSPFAVLGKGVARLAGQYLPSTGVSQTVDDLVKQLPAGEGDAFKQGVSHLFSSDMLKREGVTDLGQVKVGAVHRLVKSMQVGRSQDSTQAAGVPIQGVLAQWEPLKRWTERYVESFPHEQRQAAYNAVVSIYNGLTHALKGAAVAPNRVSELTEVTRLLRGLPEDPTFKALLPTTEQGRTYAQQALDKLNEAHNVLFGEGLRPGQGVVPQMQQTLSSAGSLKDPNALLDTVMGLDKQMEDIGTIDPGTGKFLPGKLDGTIRDYFTALGDVVHNHAPPEVMKEYWKNARDWQHHGRQNASMIDAFETQLRQYFNSHEAATGLHVLGEMPLEHWKSTISDLTSAGGDKVQGFLENAARQHNHTDLFGNPDVDKMIAQVKQKLHDALEQMTQDTRAMRPERAEAAKAFIGKPGVVGDGLSNENVYHLANYMSQTAARHGSIRSPLAALEDIGAEGFGHWLGGLAQNERAIMNRFRLPYEDSWAYHQVVHEPNALGKLWNRTMEPVINAVLRNHGWPQRLVETFNSWEGLHEAAKSTSHAETLKWHFDELPQRLAGFKADMSKADLAAVDRAVTDIASYKNSMLTPEAEAKWKGVMLNALGPDDLKAVEHIPDEAEKWKAILKRSLTNRELEFRGGRDLYAHQIATEHVNRGNQELARVFGIPWKPGQPVPDELKAIVQSVQEGINPRMEALFSGERMAGQKSVMRENYFPGQSNLIGSHTDRQEFLKTLREIRDQEQLDDKGMPVLSSNASYEKTRKYESSAHRQYDIDQVAAYRAAQKSPGRLLDVKVDDSLASRMATRYLEHHRSLANKNLIHELSDILPSQVLSFLPPKAGGMKVGEGFQKFDSTAKMAEHLGFKNLKDLAPSMDGYYVAPKLYDYMAGHIHPFEDPTQEEALSGMFTGPLRKLLIYLKHANMSFSGQHIKNTMAQALVRGGPDIFKRAGEIVAEAGRNYATKNPKWYSPVMPLARALEDHPLHQIGVRNGLFRAGQEYNIPIQQLIRNRIDPSSVGQGLKTWGKSGVGPMNAATFGVTDPALRMALMEKYAQMGMTWPRAAEMANHAMVDYSMRYLTPSARKLLYSTAVFPAWTVGSWLTHGLNVMENPSRYAIISHVARALSDRDEDDHGAPGLVVAIATGHVAPGTNQQVWIRPGFNWQSIMNLEKQTVDEMAAGHPVAAGMGVGKYLTDRLWPFPYRAYQAFHPRGGMPAAEKQTVMGTLFGDPKRSGDTGLVGGALWGLQAQNLPELFKVIYDPQAWASGEVAQQWQQTRVPLPGADVRGWLENLITSTVQQKPDGKVVY